MFYTQTALVIVDICQQSGIFFKNFLIKRQLCPYPCQTLFSKVCLTRYKLNGKVKKLSELDCAQTN